MINYYSPVISLGSTLRMLTDSIEALELFYIMRELNIDNYVAVIDPAIQAEAENERPESDSNDD